MTKVYDVILNCFISAAFFVQLEVLLLVLEVITQFSTYSVKLCFNCEELESSFAQSEDGFWLHA